MPKKMSIGRMRKDLSKIILSLRSKINDYEQRSLEVKKIDQVVTNLNLFISNKNTDEETITNLFVFLSKLDETIKNPNVTYRDCSVYYHSQACSASDLDY